MSPPKYVAGDGSLSPAGGLITRRAYPLIMGVMKELGKKTSRTLKRGLDKTTEKIDLEQKR